MSYTDDLPIILGTLGCEMKEVFEDILTSLSLVQEGPLNAAQKVHLQHCRKGIHRASRSLEDVLMLSNGISIESGPAPFSPQDRVATIAEVLEPLAKRAEVKLETEVDDAIPTIKGDVAIFDQVATRILDYAIRCSQSGIVRLSMKSAGDGSQHTLWLSAAVLKPHPYMTDNDVSLSLAKILVARLGGKLDYTSTTESVSVQAFLPITPCDSHPRSVSKPNVRVLIAEDSDESFQIFSVYLTDQGCSISRACDGEEAVTMATAGEHDLVFMDIAMPKIDGYAATRRIREYETAHGTGRIPIVVLSADPIASQLRQGAVAGCTGYLEKPVSRSLLVRTLDQYTSQIANGSTMRF